MTAGDLREGASRLIRTVRFDRPESERPLPRVGIDLGTSVPVWVLRIALVAVALGCSTSLITQPGQWVAAITGAAVITIWPYAGLAQIYGAALGVGLALGPSHPFATRVFILILGVHLLMVLGAILDDLAWSARVELRALLIPARRIAIIQIFAQSLAVVGAVVSKQNVETVWIPTAVVVVFAVASWAALSRIARTSMS